jgi:NhaP-type Na+/H+ or K+/H+ antiporter
VVIQGGQIFSMDGIMMIILTVIISILSSYLLVFFFTKIKTHIKFFLMLAILALLYSLGKQLHLSPLLIILIFGLVLNNTRLFFFGKMKEFLDFEAVENVTRDFKVVTGETAFVVRTFFFVTFGFSINLAVVADWRVISIGTVIVAILYLVRYLNFRIFLKTEVFPEIFLAPRGLITILLFFSIPAQYQIQNFSVGILFFVILATSIIMMIALIRTPGVKSGDVRILEKGLSPSSSLFSIEPSGPHCSVENNFSDDSQDKT